MLSLMPFDVVTLGRLFADRDTVPWFLPCKTQKLLIVSISSSGWGYRRYNKISVLNMINARNEQQQQEQEQEQHRRSGIISLDGYSTFQYMLATPSLAKPILDQITSITFYDEPKDSLKKSEREHKILLSMRTKSCRVIAYYACCLTLLPSHVLGMSKWRSSSSYPSPTTTVHSSLYPFQILRHFQYSYYDNMLQVDTYHVYDSTIHSSDNNKQSFRLVEFFTWTNKLTVYMICGGFYVFIIAVLINCWRLYVYM